MFCSLVLLIVCLIALIFNTGYSIITFSFNNELFLHNKLIIWCYTSILFLLLSLIYNLYHRKNAISVISKVTQPPKKQYELVEKINKSLKIPRIEFVMILTAGLAILLTSFSFQSILAPSYFPDSNVEALKGLHIFGLLFFYITLFFIKPEPVIELYLSENSIKPKFKFTDKYCGIFPLFKLLNSTLLLGINVVFSSTLILYSLYFSSDIPYECKFLSFHSNSLYDFVLSLFSLLTILFVSFIYIFYYIRVAKKAYSRLITNLAREKKSYLDKLEKKGDLESLIMYNIVKEKTVLSLYDKITLPAKILLTPTFITYLRQKILTTTDIDNFIYSLFQ